MVYMTKAIIRKVGHVETDGSVIGWHFDCSNGAPGLIYYPDGSVNVGGYTVEELREIPLEPEGAG